VKVLITGAGGFVGSHVVRHWLTETDDHLVLPVTMRHRGRWDRLEQQLTGVRDYRKPSDVMRRVTLLSHDLRAGFSPSQLAVLGDVEVIINVASESHVDRSIAEPRDFVEGNVSLAITVLELARAVRPRLVLQISTDEVYGPAYGDYRHREWDPVIPSNPYAASKACQEAIAVSYWRTYGVPLVLTNTMNLIGEMQDPEKFVPRAVARLAAGEPVPVHVGDDGVAGSRFYLHARNQAAALLFLTRHHLARPPASHAAGDARPERYHVVGEREVRNDEMVDLVAAAMGVTPRVEPVNFHASRPGHDLRYALDGSRLAALGWWPPLPLEVSLKQTVRWTLQHPQWLR
jgi:dTDP-glucose 4,6-dehydratase